MKCNCRASVGARPPATVDEFDLLLIYELGLDNGWVLNRWLADCKLTNSPSFFLATCSPSSSESRTSKTWDLFWSRGGDVPEAEPASLIILPPGVVPVHDVRDDSGSGKLNGVLSRPGKESGWTSRRSHSPSVRLQLKFQSFLNRPEERSSLTMKHL